MAETLRVAVAGASGIGKHHAKWHQASGARVCAFWGRSPESCTATEKTLREMFGFQGRGYWDLEQLLEQEQPDLVDICLPNELHFEAARAALEAGCHVLCEKPLVWNQGAETGALLAQAGHLVELARERSLQLGVCTQYAAALPHYLQLYEPERGPVRQIASFQAEMETLSRGRRRSAAEIWIDMGPHPLSLLLAWMPDGQIEAGSLEARLEGREARAAFVFAGERGRCQCHIAVRDREGGAPARRFGINEFLVECSGRADVAGVYRSVLGRGQQEIMGEDFMSLHIGQFQQAARDIRLRPLAPGEIGLRNMELQVQILQGVSS